MVLRKDLVAHFDTQFAQAKELEAFFADRCQEPLIVHMEGKNKPKKATNSSFVHTLV